ncbi:MAG: HNH endonuclease [Bdellovibrio sp.]
MNTTTAIKSENVTTRFSEDLAPSIKVSFLSNTELLSRFGKLVQTERRITHLVLECIAEIDSRRLYLDKAYPSLYEYLVQGFGYSSSAALRRIESARLLRDIPGVAEKIESGALNLSQLSKVQQAVRTVQKVEDRKLDLEEKRELLSRIEHTTQQQTEVILSQALSLPVFSENKEKNHRDESVTLTITFSKEQMAILKKAQDLIAHAVPEKKWAETMTYLAQKEIHRRTEVKISKKRSEISKSENGIKASSKFSTKPSRKPLSTALKKLILNRDKCCQYKDNVTGKTCGSTRFLQNDHRQSVWAGGSDEISNLQMLCAQHNRYKYQKESGQSGRGNLIHP